jgi:hypothetical protein
MISGKIVYLCTIFGEQFEMMQYLEIIGPDSMTIFNPEIEQVANNVQLGCTAYFLFQKPEKPLIAIFKPR